MVPGIRHGLLRRLIVTSCCFGALWQQAEAATMTFQRSVSPTSSYSAMYDLRIYANAASSSPINSDVLYLNYPTGARVLAYFDLSALPAGSTVTQATLQYNFYSGKNINAPVGVYRVRTNWLGGSTWQNAGGDWADKNGTAQGTTPYATVMANVNGWYSWDLTPLVQAWTSGSAPNYGVLLIAEASATGYGQAYGSGHTTTSVHPRLVVTYTATADTTPPTLSVVTATNITASGAKSTWTTNESSTSQVEYGTTTAYGQSTTLDSTMVTAHSVTLSGLIAGTLYHYRVKSKDSSNNQATSTDFTFTTTAAADTTKPTVSLTAPATGAAVGGSAVQLTATASDNVGVAGVQFKLDGANLGSEDTAAPYAAAWNTTTAAEGAHSLTAVARDAAGNAQTSVAINVTVDNTAPVLSITSPVDGAVIANP